MDVARKHLTAIYSRLVVDGGALKDQPPDGPTKVTLDKLKPQFREELNKRIFSSANLIQLNREQAIERTVQRFQGWVTSIPPDGVSEIDKNAQKQAMRKSVSDLDYISRRVAIDQGHKLASNVKYLLSVQSGAIAFVWHSNWRRPGYNYRVDHKDRDTLTYLVRGSWAIEQGLIKPVHGSGAFDILSGGAPTVKIGSNDLVVYQRILRARTQAHVGQSLPGQLPSSSIVPSYDQMMTYRISTRSQYSYLDTEAASAWGYSLNNGLWATVTINMRWFVIQRSRPAVRPSQCTVWRFRQAHGLCRKAR